MDSVEIAPFRDEHMASLLPRLCASHRDRAESLAPLEEIVGATLPASVLLRTGLVDGRPECVMGLTLAADVGWPWLLKTERAERRFRSLVRHCRSFIAECHAHRALLRAGVEPDDEMLRRWLTWLGFRRVGEFQRWDRWERSYGD